MRIVILSHSFCFKTKFVLCNTKAFFSRTASLSYHSYLLYSLLLFAPFGPIKVNSVWDFQQLFCWTSLRASGYLKLFNWNKSFKYRKHKLSGFLLITIVFIEEHAEYSGIVFFIYHLPLFFLKAFVNQQHCHNYSWNSRGNLLASMGSISILYRTMLVLLSTEKVESHCLKMLSFYTDPKMMIFPLPFWSRRIGQIGWLLMNPSMKTTALCLSLRYYIEN